VTASASTMSVNGPSSFGLHNSAWPNFTATL
jgi:hypothetical protein